MGILNNFMDKFKNAEFTVAPQKKLKTISADFKKSFELSLVFYKGVKIADPHQLIAENDLITRKGEVHRPQQHLTGGHRLAGGEGAGQHIDQRIHHRSEQQRHNRVDDGVHDLVFFGDTHPIGHFLFHRAPP